jgi:hypothetical protein
VLSACAIGAPMMSAVFEAFRPTRLGALMLVLLLLHLAMRRWLLLTRELLLYLAFFAYMSLSLLWAPSVNDGLNTILPAANFMLIMILIGSLVAYHDLSSVIFGSFFGFVSGALIYTGIVGFPFKYPIDFSYNAVALMYLCGLFITLVFGWHTRSRIIPLLVSLIVMVHIAATTSIKTNLGIVLGASSAALVYSGSFLRLFRRNIVMLGILVAALVFAIASNDNLLDRVQHGLDRVSHGVEILQRREDVAGNTSFGERTDWETEGIKGWVRSPVFGNGVEAFRTDHGITSHSTPIDLLYNNGVVGFAIFYSIFVSLALRLIAVRGTSRDHLPPLIFAGLICYGFITLSGTMHYNTFMAIFFAFSIGLLRRFSERTSELPAGWPAAAA